MNPADLPIRVRLEWPAGIVQYGSATKPNVQEFNAGGDRYVTVTAKLDPPFDHLAHAKAALDQEDTMNEYTAEDFKSARFAEHADGRIAMRAEPETGVPWYVGDDQIKRLDVAMARDGWRPVHEAPLTLETLREAWEQAEVPTDDNPPREGDTIIEFDASPCYRVTVVGCDWGGLTRYDSAFVRILSRAHPRAPWADLADVLADMGHLSPTGHAKDLHERGVRVTAVSHDG